MQLYENATRLHSFAKSFPETPLQTLQLMWCISIYIGKDTSILVEY